MKIHIIHHYPDSTAINNKLDRILALLEVVAQKEQHMTVELDDLTAQVTAIETQSDSIITLCNGLAEQLAAAKEDPAAIQALADSLKTKAQAIADAVAANTPAA